MPPLHAAHAALREITEGAEPETYEERRPILEGILDLRLKYANGDLEIEGKVPVPDVAVSAASGKKKCNKGLGAVGFDLCWRCHDLGVSMKTWARFGNCL